MTLLSLLLTAAMLRSVNYEHGKKGSTLPIGVICVGSLLQQDIQLNHDATQLKQDFTEILADQAQDCGLVWF